MSINPNLYSEEHKNPRSHKKYEREIPYYVRGIDEGNRFILSESITLLESTLQYKRAKGLRILDAFNDKRPNTIRIGITGTPGVGKSTFIEALGRYFISKGHRLAVLAIDPSSQINKGSILGDKHRMQTLSSLPEAFIRPTASGATLGGTAIHTKETIKLCEAAGFDTVFIETVGVGQSEIEVGFMTDVNILLLQPGAGDEIQGIKRGIMENADIFIINKSDGVLLPLAKQTKRFYRNAIQLFHHEVDGWECPVMLVSSVEHTGLDAVYEAIFRYKDKLEELNIFDRQRVEQDVRWFHLKTKDLVENIMLNHPRLKSEYIRLIAEIQNQSLSALSALTAMEARIKSFFQ